MIEACQRHRIIFTNANSFWRGVETLIEAVAILKKSYPDISLALAGGVELLPYGEILQKRITALDIQNEVDFLGRLNEVQLVEQLKKAHVFVITSLIENSPNSLCEAQALGLPCIATYTGGITSLIDDGHSGLFCPPRDSSVLAERIREVFENDDLAQQLGTQARRTALNRHDPTKNTKLTIDAYREVMNNNQIQILNSAVIHT